MSTRAVNFDLLSAKTLEPTCSCHFIQIEANQFFSHAFNCVPHDEQLLGNSWSAFGEENKANKRARGACKVNRNLEMSKHGTFPRGTPILDDDGDNHDHRGVIAPQNGHGDIRGLPWWCRASLDHLMECHCQELVSLGGFLLNGFLT